MPKHPNESQIKFIKEIADLGNSSAYAVYKETGNPRYRPIGNTVTDDVISSHLTSEQPIGCTYVLGSETHVGTTDCDDHGGSLLSGKTVVAGRIVERECNPEVLNNG